MEEEESLTAKDVDASLDMEEIRQRRLAYFQTTNPSKMQATANVNKKQPHKQGTGNKPCDPVLLKKGNVNISAKTSEFRLAMKTSKEDISKRMNSQSEDYISYSSTRSSQDKPQTGHSAHTEPVIEKRRTSLSSLSDDHISPLVKSSHSRPDVTLTSSVSENTPHFVNTHKADDSGRWATSADNRPLGNKPSQRVLRKSGDKEVDILFSTRKSTSATEIPTLSLKESIDIDSVSVFKSKADFDDLGMSTHRPESTTSSSVIDFAEKRQMTRQRSVSSESLLLGGKAEEMKILLGEQKYREFVEKSERELNKLHKTVDSQDSSIYRSGGNKPERSSRIDGSAPRNTPTPPPQPPSPQPAGASKRGPSPRRRLRSSSPQMVSKTLQDIARTKEIREAGSSRNYEQVVIPHNVTFSADEIYRQAYGGDNNAGNDLRKSSNSIGSSYQDPSTLFWNNVTPRQMAGGMSPTSPHTAPMFQPHFMPVSSGGPVHPPAPPPPTQPMSVGSPGTYFYPQGGVAVSMAGGGGGQFMYSHPPNMFVPMSPGTSPQSPEPYFYHIHPMSQSMPGFHSSSSPMQSPSGRSWQYAHHQGPGMSQEFQGHKGQESLQWNHFGHRPQHNANSNQYGQNSNQYNHNWQHNHPGMIQTPHPPSRGGGDTDRSMGKSSAEHADAVRQFHEQRRQEQEKQAYSSSNNHPTPNFSASSLQRYFASLGIPPPNYPPPPYHLHQPPPSLHPQSSQQTPKHSHQRTGNRQSTDMQTSADTQGMIESSDYDDMTTVTKTSFATGTSFKAGGITDRLEQIGVDPVVMQSIKQLRSETAAADEEALEAMRNLVRICPECQAVNKEYMTWCLQCGGVLIGIDPIPAKDLKKKSREKKSSTDSPSKSRKSTFQGSVDESVSDDVNQHSFQEPSKVGMKEAFSVEVRRSVSQEPSKVGKMVPLEVQHCDTQEVEEHPDISARSSLEEHHSSLEDKHSVPEEPVLEFEEIIEEEIIYNSFIKERGQDSPEAVQIPEVTSPLRESENDIVEEEAVETKESPESGRGASASSSPCRRNISREVSEDVGEMTQNMLEVSDNKDSGRPSSGEGADSRKPHVSSQLVPEGEPRRSEKEINDICEVINDPVIRGFIKNYLQKKPEEPAPDLSQISPTKHRNSALGNFVGRRNNGATASNDTATASHSQASKSFSIDLGATTKTSAAAKSKITPGKKEDTPKTPKRKSQKKGCKKGHEAIDVEIFAIEEAKVLRSSRSGANVVPKLNLVHSSDEDEDSSEKTSSLQGAHGANSDASSPREDHAPVNYSNDIQVLVAPPQAQEENNNPPPQPQDQDPISRQANPDIANSNFHFLKELVENKRSTTPTRGKKTGQACQQAQHRPSPVSKVRASIDAPPPNRRWMRSSIAWSSYHPRELRTRSSQNFQAQPSASKNNGPTRQSSGNFRASRSSDNLVNPVPSEVAPSQRPRPASADQNNRSGANRGRPSSAGHGQRPYSAGYNPKPQTRTIMEGSRSAAAGDHSSSDPQPSSSQDEGGRGKSPRCQDTDIEGRPIHRLIVQEDTLPLIPAGPSTALKIYDRCFEMSPRDEMNHDSKWLLLPDELWLHVFTYLPQIDLHHVTLACKQLYRIALDPQLWKRVTVRKKPMRDEWLAEIARRHPLSLAMVQCHGDNVSENALRELFKEIAPKLKELNFSRCSKGKLIGDELLLHASTHCRHLTHVDASWCHVTDVGLTALAGCCHRLESLCLNGCQQITDDSLKTVLEKHGTSLRVLELFGCFSLTPVSFRNLAEHCTFLLTLNIGQCYKISDSNMVTLSASLSRVETLDLRGCKKLGDNSIRKIVRSCRRLRHLILANCPLLSNASIVEIATYSTDIRSLDICGCRNISDSSIQTLANNCFRLISIDISSTSCTHRSVLMLANSSRNLESAKFNFLADIHEKSLAKLIRNCKRLNTIHLYGCNVRDAATLRKYNRFLSIEM